jgi:hypothetical protein
MNSWLKPPGAERFKLKCDIMLSTVAFKFNSRRYSLGVDAPATRLIRKAWPALGTTPACTFSRVSLSPLE